MKIKVPSFEIMIVKDSSKMINVGANINIFDLNNFKELYRLNSLKDPSHIAVSDDEKYFACSDTSGNIEVYDLKTGKLILKNKGVSCEGGNIYFLKDNVVSISWNGEVFSLDVNKNICNVLLKTDLVCFNMHIIKDKILLISPEYTKRTKIYEVKINENKAILDLFIETNDYIVCNNAYYFNDKECYLYAYRKNFLCRNDCMVKINFENKTIENALDISNIIGINSFRIFLNMGDIKDFIVCNDKKLLILAYSKSVLFIDLLQNKVINSLKFDYISNINLLENNKLIVGMWENIKILSLNDLL